MFNNYSVNKYQMANLFVSITEINPSKEAMVAIFNMSGAACMHFGLGHTSFWILPNNKKDREETIAQLESVPGLHSVYVVSLSNPVTIEEVGEVRKMLNVFSIDTSAVTDDKLAAYLNSILDNKSTFYIEFDDEAARKGDTKLLIAALEEHPDFSPQWLLQPYTSEEDLLGREYTVDDFEIETESFEDIIEEEDEVQPPWQDSIDKQSN